MASVPKWLVDGIVSFLLPRAIEAAKEGYPPKKFGELCEEAAFKGGKEVNDGLDKALKNGEIVENVLQEYFNAGIDGIKQGFNRGCDIDE